MLKRAEFYLILITIICSSTVFLFKEKTVVKFNSFDFQLNMFLLDADSKSTQEYFTNFEKDFEALVIINKNLKLQTEKMKGMSVTDEHFVQELQIFQNEVKDIKNMMDTAFDSILYVSFFLLTIAVFIIIFKNYKKIKELSKIKIINDIQNKISRDLHDTVIQDLKALKLYVDKNDIKSNELKEYYLNQAYNETRYLMSSINHVDFNEDFTKILRDTLRTFENNFKIRTQFFEATELIQNFELQKKIEIYRIFQEALNNIARHSKASLVTVKIIDSILINKKVVKLIINDNGIGIKDEDFEKENHYGLKNIAERVELLGGDIKITGCEEENGEKNGTTISIDFTY